MIIVQHAYVLFGWWNLGFEHKSCSIVFFYPQIVNSVTNVHFGIETGSYWQMLFLLLLWIKTKLYTKSDTLPGISHMFKNVNITLIILLTVHKDLALGQTTSSPFTEHTCCICGNPLGTAGSLRASAVNKRAPAHMQWWCRREGWTITARWSPAGPNNEAGPASWSSRVAWC